MYIHPFIAGMISTVLLELAIIIIVAMVVNRNKGGK